MMACSTFKLYNVHGFDPRTFLDDFLSDKPEMAFGDDLLRLPIEFLKRTFIEGNIKGDVLIDLSTGPMIHHLYAASDFFKHIIVLKVSDRCIMELKRWLNTRTGAFNWRHATKLHAKMEGKSDQLQKNEEKVREAAQHVMKCNLGKENLTDPIVLPLADCIISACLIGFVSKSKDEYVQNLKKVSRLLKPGGHLIFFAAIGVTYITVGKDKLHILNYEEDFVREALAEAGFVIDICEIRKRTAVSNLIDYKAIMHIAAYKEK